MERNREALSYKILIEMKIAVLSTAIRLKNFFGLSKLTVPEDADGRKKVQVGSGAGRYGVASASLLPGWLNTDLLSKFQIDVSKRFNLPDSSVDIIFSSHVIEHLTQKQIRNFFKESSRVLRNGGLFICATPDLEKITRLLYCSADAESRTIFIGRHSRGISGQKATASRILNHVMHINYGHKFLLDFETFEGFAQECKVFDIVREFQSTDCKELVGYFEAKPDIYQIETSIWVAKVAK